MSRPIFDRAACAAVAASLAACAAPAPQIDLCSVDPGLGAALLGGQLHAEVRAADGTPLAAAVAAVDRPSQLLLGHAADGEWIVIAAVDSGDTPVAFGAAQLHGNQACVCLARSVWYAYATWQDSSGAFHDGPPADYYVQKGHAPGLEPALSPTLDHARVQPGDVLRVTTQYLSDATAPLDVRAIEVLARPPGATHATGLVRGFSPVSVGHVAPGANVPVDATREFAPSDPPGTWALFTRLTDVLGVSYDGPEVSFFVGGGNSDALVPTRPPGLNRAWVRPPDSLHMTASFTNPGTQPITAAQIVLTTRPPGGSNGAGPFDDFSRLMSTTVGPGETLDLAGDRSFALADDPCAGMVCVVSGGKCQLSAAP
jgi:hypothetical protein